jgi:hypothetical protein
MQYPIQKITVFSSVRTARRFSVENENNSKITNA